MPSNTYASGSAKTEIIAISQQQKNVKGTVEDALGSISGASVVVKGTTRGTITDMEGKFSLEVKEGETIIISFLGYTSKEIKYAGEGFLQVNLEEDAQALGEVVVTALGIKRDAKKLGYAVSTITAGDLVKTGTPNFATSLYGKAAGVRVQAAPGGSTSAVSINIRGLSSITGTNQPLVIVDGVPIRNGEANQDDYWADQRVNSNGLVDINPEDIESLSILKGASASALYGSEAANGVILITSKSGKGRKGLGIDFNMTMSADKVAYMPELQTVFGPGSTREARTGDWLAGEGWQTVNYKGNSYSRPQYEATQQFGPRYDGREVLFWDGSTRSYSPSTDQWNNIFRTGLNQTYNLAIMQSSSKSNLRFSYTFSDNLSTQYASDNSKHNFSLNGTSILSDRIKVDYTANYMRQAINNRPYRIGRITNNFSGMFGSFEDTKLMWDKTVTSMGYLNVGPTGTTPTPEESLLYRMGSYDGLMQEYFWNIRGRKQVEDNNRFIASVTPTVNIVDGLLFRGRVSTDLTVEKIEKMENTEKPLAYGATGAYSLENRKYEIYYGDALLMYDKNITDKIGLAANFGYQARVEKAYNTWAKTTGGLSVENWFHLNASTNAKEAGMYKSDFLKQAILGTLSLSYDNYLYLEGTARQEKSSTLSLGENSFFYPSANASFIYTQAFQNALPAWYDYGKMRASWGIVGNAPAVYKANFAYIQNSMNGHIYNQIPEKLGNDRVKPEEKHEIEFGLENRFFKNRLGFEISYYTNTVKDQILETTTPWSAGAYSILQNIGELQNRGLEISIYGTPIQTKDLRWDLRGNISFNKNKVTKLMAGLDEIEHQTYDGVVRLVSRVGEPMGDMYAYVPKTDEAGNKVVGANGLYQIDFSERVKVGNAMPKTVGGFGTSLNYKSFFVDVTVDFRVGGAVLNTPYHYMMGRGNLVQSLDYRDADHGGLSYYYEGNANSGNAKIPTNQAAGPNGEKVYDDGMILQGVSADGTQNTQIVSSEQYYLRSYNWGSSGSVDYSNSIFDNTFVKMREMSLGYSLPNSLTSKLQCNNLTLSVFGRNLFYFYKNLPAFDAEATDGTTWVSQSNIGGSTATTRTFGLSLRASF